ncbi:MAG: acyl-CoA dehydrogenase [Bradymonadales bacterium]|nr:MAG: acyl-CoA dehydrogenase [Bradymonadales bacterium]
MDFDLTNEQQAVQEMARDFAKRKVAPIAEKLDRESLYPKELVSEMAGLQLMGMCVAEEYGGAGLDMLSYVLALEEVSTACASTGVIMSVNNSLVCEPIEKFGTEDQKKQFLTPLAKGEKLGCYALTEPNAGTDAANQQSRAEKKGSSYRISGTKQFITNGAEADLAIVYASTDPSKGSKGISAFIVEADRKGYKVAKKEKKLGIRGSSCVQLVLDEVEVPEENLLHQEGEGFKVALSTLEVGRIGIAAQALGIGSAALSCALAYSQEREQFGQRISNFQALQFMMADMATRLEAARLLTYRAALLKSEGKRTARESSQAKLYASEMCMYNAWAALQIHGGYGYVEDYLPERLFRDAKICEIYEGTSEVQRLLIARTLLKEV